MRNNSSGSSKNNKGGRPAGNGRATGRKPGKPGSSARPFSDNKERRDRSSSEGDDTKNFRPRKSFNNDGEAPARKFSRDQDGESREARPARKSYNKADSEGRPKRFDRDQDGEQRGERPERKTYNKTSSEGRPKRFDRDGEQRGERPERKPYNKTSAEGRPKRFDRDQDGEQRGERTERKSYNKTSAEGRPKRFDRDHDGEQRETRPARKPYGKPGADAQGRSDREQDGGPRFRRPSQDDAAGAPRRNSSRSESPEGKTWDDAKKTLKNRTGKPSADGAKKKADSRPFRERLDHAFDDLHVKGEKKVMTPEEKEKWLATRGTTFEKELPEVPKERKKTLKHDHRKTEADFNMPKGEEVMPLNKYIAHSGECSRRDAADIVKQGKVKVNGELILDPGFKVNVGDQVTLSGKKLKPQTGMVYILLNKPKGFITTNDDPQGRRTVMELVANSGAERLFAVGRLDRATTGLLLITNDGDLTQKLSHPAYNIKKVYHVTLDKPLTKADFDQIVEGVTLDDGLAPVDAMAFLEKKNEVGLEIHSGKNRIVRRIFESLGYVVEKLDRMMYAGLTKKNLPRGKWRFLTDHEILLLKHFKN